ncbi:hypothetical protein G6O69_16095 [Pseudenhygromyxa sp. WMMC2535]|uniref:hypothetical protein n=1 Tax=Pseudenhygromyxa sp. WMMC2535 TaxID=2712867 RepID=UPI00155321CB|nr:hypothetical protein [Pseudenhygromyxa sp. WMMC2535]NVB39364.1 hypothetical protein [Pseudenhygromyxa sp. WMMC2535]
MFMSNDAQTTAPGDRGDALEKSLVKAIAESDEFAAAVRAVALGAVAVVTAKAIAKLIREDVERYEREAVRDHVKAILAAGPEAKGRETMSDGHARGEVTSWPVAIADGAAGLVDFFPDDETPAEAPVYQRCRERVLRADG